HKGDILAEARIVTDGRIQHTEAGREQTQVHVAQGDLPTQVLLQFRLYGPSVAIHIEGCCKNQEACYHHHDKNADADQSLAHGSPPSEAAPTRPLHILRWMSVG